MSAAAVGVLALVGTSSLVLYGLLAHQLTPPATLARPHVMRVSSKSSPGGAGGAAAGRPSRAATRRRHQLERGTLGALAAILSGGGLLAPLPADEAARSVVAPAADTSATPTPSPDPSAAPQPTPTPVAPSPSQSAPPTPEPTESASSSPTEA
jgi:hypothetical protein